MYLQRACVHPPDLVCLQACQPCHPLCRECYGKTLGMCIDCIHYEQDGECVRNCSSQHYHDPDAAICHRCARVNECRPRRRRSCLILFDGDHNLLFDSIRLFRI